MSRLRGLTGTDGKPPNKTCKTPVMDSRSASLVVVFVTFASLLHHFLVFSKQEDLKCSSSFLRAGHSYRDVALSGK